MIESAPALSSFYQDDLVTMYQGDCEALFPDVARSLDRPFAFVTDPPYGIAWDVNGGRSPKRVREGKTWDPVIGDDRPFDPSWMIAYNVPTILWGANHYADKLPPMPGWLVWDKRPNGQHNYQSDMELAWSNRPGRAVRAFRLYWSGGPITMYRKSGEFDQGEGRYHPTQKSLALMKWCLSFIPDDLIVIDPYMGSGTTLMAAKALGRPSVGIELDPRHCAMAAARCRQETLGL